MFVIPVITERVVIRLICFSEPERTTLLTRLRKIDNLRGAYTLDQRLQKKRRYLFSILWAGKGTQPTSLE